MNRKSAFFCFPILVVLGFFLIGCDNDSNQDVATQVPVLTTTSISEITQTSAKCGGNISSEGGLNVTARGVCWSTEQTPTIADSKTSDGIGIGNFTSTISGLSPETTYYVRAYATNSDGSGYGAAISFTTQQEEITTVTDIDGNNYNTITIGTQVWMKENLKVKKYQNGDEIYNVLENSSWPYLTIGAYCEYDNNSINSVTYGMLYNYYTVSDSRNLCPSGWHVPTDTEWITLINFLGGESIAGGKLKEAGTSHWVLNNEATTNESGFTALPGGLRLSSGVYSQILSYGHWWSSSSYDANNAWYRTLFDVNSTVIRDNIDKKYGFSVRCIKD